MNCLDCKEIVQRCLDGISVGSQRAELDQHVAGCQSCRELCAAAQCLLDGLRLISPPAPPAGLGRRIAARVAADRRRRQRMRRALGGLALAASLVLAMLAYYRLRGAAEPNALPRTEQIAEAVEKLPALPSLQQRVEEAGEAVVVLTRRTADETMGQSRLLLPDIKTGSPDRAEPRETESGSFRDVQEGVSAGLEPVANSARRAVAMLLREKPPEPARKPPLPNKAPR